MAFAPFTLEEATDIAEDFEDLIDTDFDVDGVVYEVLDVLISPFHEQQGKDFIEVYRVSKDKEISLSAYTGDEYDVIIFACDINDSDKHTCIDISFVYRTKRYQV